jgi:hypothetical protein
VDKLSFAGRRISRRLFKESNQMNMQNTVYARTAKFDGTARALTEDEMRKSVPSIFATTAHASRSERFQPIPTIEVVRALSHEGFVPVGAKQCGSRDPDKRDFTKHLIRLRRIDEVAKYQTGDTVAEILLKNANDGSAAYDLMAGLFRILCLNSLVAQTNTMESLRVKHSGDVANKVIEGTYRVLDTAVAALEAPREWSTINLNRDEQMAFADAAHVARFGDADGNVDTPIKPQQLLIARRTADQQPNLWNTFNVIQENAIKGGLSARGVDTNNRPRRMTTRAVNGIDQDVKLNKALFTLASKMAELKK